ncbi:hypothetical protein [Thermosphaera aggregans]|uniref:Uncharacterized protein n=1 Tax=Thermosphaera aggregans (strain DSM 11486 / M11TL) TaxID=633148 RepID=D5U2M1_THEAM|nr:hypothetical protein [Thermosphaera aggregans]ADG91371.1 hypothetical protein Tagg_1102 [Thermosphaera aggregans DSM 11486]
MRIVVVRLDYNGELVDIYPLSNISKRELDEIVETSKDAVRSHLFLSKELNRALPRSIAIDAFSYEITIVFKPKGILVLASLKDSVPGTQRQGGVITA